MNIKELKELKNQGIVNFSKLSQLSGINYQTLLAKIRRNSELKITESQSIEKALRKLNV